MAETLRLVLFDSRGKDTPGDLIGGAPLHAMHDWPRRPHPLRPRGLRCFRHAGTLPQRLGMRVELSANCSKRS
jgi:hypothetical protein